MEILVSVVKVLVVVVEIVAQGALLISHIKMLSMDFTLITRCGVSCDKIAVLRCKRIK